MNAIARAHNAHVVDLVYICTATLYNYEPSNEIGCFAAQRIMKWWGGPRALDVFGSLFKFNQTAVYLFCHTTSNCHETTIKLL